MQAPTAMISIHSLLRRLRQEDWTLRSGDGNSIQILLRRILNLAFAEIKAVVGIDSYLESEDRRVLEQVIFPYFLGDDTYSNVLFVGCSWCTKAYNKRFEEKKNYWTIDAWRLKKRYGAKQHVIDGLQNLGSHFQPGALDLILCNGVFGYGLDGKTDVEQAFQACGDCLREGGVLVIGYADIAERCPFPLADCRSLRAAFEPFVFPPLGKSEYLTDTPWRHKYSFYVKK